MNDGTPRSDGASGIDSILSSVLSSPDAMAKISKIISNHTSKGKWDDPPQSGDNTGNFLQEQPNREENAPVYEQDSPTIKNDDFNEGSSDALNISSIFSSIGSQKGSENDKQTTLLLAVRPFLSKRRQELLDTLLGVSKIGKLFMDIK